MNTVSETVGAGEKAAVNKTEVASPTARFSNKRLAREWKTMAAMVHCYCHGQHGTVGELCGDCQGLLEYATIRLDRCRYGAEKPTCANCPIHCYQR
ncbi:MAG TPA: nitrous oxide-stimulated promoter family protein, partial [Clostridia bacterium]|nr:nitrous oxide-stimulated promoter family protein [Clostridia bacterium]